MRTEPARKVNAAGQIKPDLHDLRDKAMLALPNEFALRRSELVSIDLGALGDGGAVLRLEQNAAHLWIRRSKTARDKAETVSLPRDANPLALGAIERWIREAQIDDGSPVLRKITPRGTVSLERIAADSATRAIQNRIRLYYIATPTLAACSNRLSVDLPASTAQFERLRVSVPPSTPRMGSWRS